jgi:hypothetical protein
MSDMTKSVIWLDESHSMKTCMVDEWLWVDEVIGMKVSMVDEWCHKKSILAWWESLREDKYGR